MALPAVIDWKTYVVCHADGYSQGPVFAWLAPNGEELTQVHVWSRCRDIVGGYLQGSLLQDTDDYGGVHWNSRDLDLAKDQINLGIRIGRVEKNIQFSEAQLAILIWRIEEQLGVSPTRITAYDAPPGTGYEGDQLWLLQADPFWMKSPTLFSLYLLLLRVTPYVQDQEDLDTLLSQKFPGHIGAEGLKDCRNTLHWILERKASAWKAPQPAYFSKSDPFRNRGFNFFTYLSVELREKLMDHGDPDYQEPPA